MLDPPPSWASLLRARPELLAKHLAILPVRMRVAARPPAGSIKMDFFESVSALLAESLVLCGPGGVRPSMKLLVPTFDAALAELAEQPQVRPRSIAAALAFYNLMQCTGLETSNAQMEAVLAAMVRAATGDLDAAQRLTLAWAALALIEYDLAQELAADGEPLFALQRDACVRGTGGDEVARAWLDYVTAFPAADAARPVPAGAPEVRWSTGWSTLFCAAVTQHNRIEGGIAGETAHLLHRLVLELAQAGR